MQNRVSSYYPYVKAYTHLLLVDITVKPHVDKATLWKHVSELVHDQDFSFQLNTDEPPLSIKWVKLEFSQKESENETQIESKRKNENRGDIFVARSRYDDKFVRMVTSRLMQHVRTRIMELYSFCEGDFNLHFMVQKNM